MNGLTDKQFEMVCRLATTAAGEDSDRLPLLLEELLAAARRGLGTDEHRGSTWLNGDGIHGSYTPEPNKIPPPPPHTHESHKDFDSDGATGGES